PGNSAGERNDTQAGGFMADGKAFLRLSFHSKATLLPPNRSLEVFPLHIDALGNPEWRPRVANLARSGWGLLLKVADPVVQADLFDQLLSWAIPIGESQERIESDHGVGLTASTLAPHTKPRQQVRNGPESRPSRILVESEAALHTDGGDCNRFLFQLNGDG